ncbi:hypothetical protein L596_015772 [Steinernema carpocapsae]|uniref:cystathionine gamma-lyase n=1 Tax=Steinernema carpocapsae TaxID=34508 RepID=A0A4U5NGL9_STECR|nr:hypothetical protein L596_015772 [Steinernema carpocapsae]
MHSMTKYLNGHNDVLIGEKDEKNDEKLHDLIRFCHVAMGTVPSPFDGYLANRGLKTLPIRMEKRMENALAIIQLLESHPAIEHVSYPALPSSTARNLQKADDRNERNDRLPPQGKTPKHEDLFEQFEGGFSAGNLFLRRPIFIAWC